jgi:hypothetical protein
VKTLDPLFKSVLDNYGAKRAEEVCMNIINALYDTAGENKEIKKIINVHNSMLGRDTDDTGDSDDIDWEREYRELSKGYYYPEKFSYDYANTLVELLKPYLQSERQTARIFMDVVLDKIYKPNDYFFTTLLELMTYKRSRCFTEAELLKMITEFIRKKYYT